MIPRYLVDFDVAELTRLEADVLIIGSGIAGLYTAIKAAENRKVLLITKKTLMESNTRYAQGGIAAVTSDEDTPAYHMQDTLIAGAGLCEPEAVRTLVHEGPVGIQELIRMGTAFDRVDGELALTREGAHSHRRILHANGDATGYEIVRALSKQVAAHPGIEVWEECMVIDLLTEHGECIKISSKSQVGKGRISLLMQRFCAQEVAGNYTVIRLTRILQPGMVLLWRIVLGRLSGIWNSYSFILRRCAIRALQGF